MSRFTLPRDLYHGKGALETLKTLKGKRAIVCVGGGSMKRGGFLDRALAYLKEAGMETKVIEGIESDPSVETVMNGAAVMQEFQPDWIVAMGGGSPIDAAKAMWIKYEYPETTFADMACPNCVRKRTSALSLPPAAPPRKLRRSPSSPIIRRVSNTPSPILKLRRTSPS